MSIAIMLGTGLLGSEAHPFTLDMGGLDLLPPSHGPANARSFGVPLETIHVAEAGADGR
jgi:hypothetical protein